MPHNKFYSLYWQVYIFIQIVGMRFNTIAKDIGMFGNKDTISSDFNLYLFYFGLNWIFYVLRKKMNITRRFDKF